MLLEPEITRPNLERRLNELRQELATGETQLAALDKKRIETSQTMLRITGAIQVLEELLQEPAEHNIGSIPSADSAAAVAANGLQPAAVEA